MTDLSRSRWIAGVAAIAVLAVVVAAVWSTGTASPSAEQATVTRPPVTVQYRMASVKTATPAATATASLQATRAATTPAATATLVPTLPAAPTSAVLASLGQVPRIAVDAARAQVDMGMALFVDVRTAATFKQGHLPGAISLPGGVSDNGYRELPDDRLLIFYCA